MQPVQSNVTGRPTQYTPAARKFMELSLQLSKQKETGAVDSKTAGALNEAAASLGPDDLKSMRYVAGDRMKAELTPRLKEGGDVQKAAQNLINMVDNGVLPGLGGGPTLDMESGRPATPEQIQAAKQTPALPPPASKGWVK